MEVNSGSLRRVLGGEAPDHQLKCRSHTAHHSWVRVILPTRIALSADWTRTATVILKIPAIFSFFFFVSSYFGCKSFHRRLYLMAFWRLCPSPSIAFAAIRNKIAAASRWRATRPTPDSIVLMNVVSSVSPIR